MKSILKWLEEAKEQGCNDHSNINAVSPASLEALTEALRKLNNALEAYEAMKASYEEQLTEVKAAEGEETAVLESLIEDLGKLNNALENLKRNETLKEPYRTQVYEATKDSYEEQLAEVKVKIAEALGIEPIKERKLIGWVTADANGCVLRRYNSLRKVNNCWVRGWGKQLTPEEAMALCGRVPSWSDDEPTPIYA